MSFVWFTGLLLALCLQTLALISWVLLLSGKFRTWFIKPAANTEEKKEGKIGSSCSHLPCHSEVSLLFCVHGRKQNHILTM